MPLKRNTWKHSEPHLLTLPPKIECKVKGVIEFNARPFARISVDRFKEKEP